VDLYGVVWSAKSYNEGDDGVFFLGRGKVNTAHSMASEMAQLAVHTIAREGNSGD
jgi:hypothetical protein